MENGELKMDNAWGMETARALLIIFHSPFIIFNSREARNDGVRECVPCMAFICGRKKAMETGGHHGIATA
jgi:hypothetical protein